MEANLPQGFTVFLLLAAPQKRLRTSNALERVNMELKRRSRVGRGGSLRINRAGQTCRIEDRLAVRCTRSDLVRSLPPICWNVMQPGKVG